MDAFGEEQASSKETNLLDRWRQDFQNKTSQWTEGKGLAGQSNVIASKASCDRAYWAIGHSQLYFALQNSLRYPTAPQYVERLVKESPTQSWVVPRVAVLTFTTLKGSSYFVAQELALLGVDLILAGKSLKKMKRIQEKIQREGYVRKGKTPKLILRKLKYDPQRLQDVQDAANRIRSILRDHYDDQLPILIHGLASVQTNYKTTPDGLESNQAHQFLYPHFLTQRLLPNLKKSATSSYRPRVVAVSSVGHCQGTDFNFERFIVHPEQGGAPSWTFESTNEETETTTPSPKLQDVAESAKASFRSLQNSFATPFRTPSSDGSTTTKKSMFSSFFGNTKEDATMDDSSGKNTSMLLSVKQRLSLEKRDNQRRPEPRKSWSYVPPEAMLQSTEENDESSDEEEEEVEKVIKEVKEEKEEKEREVKTQEFVTETENKLEPQDDIKEREGSKEEAEKPTETEDKIEPKDEIQEKEGSKDRAEQPKEDPNKDDIHETLRRNEGAEQPEEKPSKEDSKVGTSSQEGEEELPKEEPPKDEKEEVKTQKVEIETESKVEPNDDKKATDGSKEEAEKPTEQPPKEDAKEATSRSKEEEEEEEEPPKDDIQEKSRNDGAEPTKEDTNEAATNKASVEKPKEEPPLVGMNLSIQTTTTTTCQDAQPKERSKIASMADTEAFALVKMYYRSKMASLADSIALGREEPSLAVLSVYPGSVEANKPKKGLGMADAVYQTAFKAFQLSPSQAARSTLRAALDPDVNTHETFRGQGTYLHCDGNPWTVADPTVLKNGEGQPYTLGEYATHVRASARKICSDILPNVEYN